MMANESTLYHTPNDVDIKNYGSPNDIQKMDKSLRNDKCRSIHPLYKYIKHIL